MSKVLSGRNTVRPSFILIGLSLLVISALPSKVIAGGDTGHAPTFDLMHLWLADIEAPALQVLRNAIESAGLEWHEHRVQGNFYGIRTTFSELVSLGVPPKAVFWIGGDELTFMVDAKVVRPISGQLTRGRLRKFLRPEILTQISHDGAYTSLPLVIHLQNVALVNKTILKLLNLDHFNSWNQFIEAAPRIKDAGFIPLAMSDQHWQLRFLFQSMLSDGLSKDEFSDLLLAKRGDAWSRAQLLKAFKILLAVKPFANDDFLDLSWNEVIYKVRDGQAALTISGDFLAPSIRKIETVACTQVPGEKFVSWSFDVLAFPTLKSPQERQIQDRAIMAMSNPEFLANFAIKKGGVPVIEKVNSQELDNCSARSLTNWTTMDKLFLGSERWRLQFNSISSIAQDFWRSTDPDPGKYADLLLQEIKSISAE